MSRYRRWNQLLELLAAEGRLQVERAAKELGVSEATIRRDFDELADQQMRYKSERRSSETRRIAEVAAALVQRGQVMMA